MQFAWHNRRASRKSPRRASKPANRVTRRLGRLESLENRVMMAADVADTDWVAALVGKLQAQAATAAPVTITSSLPLQSGYHRTTTNTASLSGTADPTAGSVMVAGLPATFNQAAGTWTISNLPLNPGINRLTGRAYTGANGTGTAINEAFIDIWSQTGAGTTVPNGTLPSGTTTWTAEAGPYNVNGTITVPANGTLVIEPGTTVFFGGSGRIVINGRMMANGTDAEHIRFTRIPGGSRWRGIEFTNTLQDNQMTYVDHEYGDEQGHSVGVDDSRVTIDHANWAFANRTVIEVENPSLLVKNSHFPAIGAGEVIHGEHIINNEYLILDGNVFDRGTSNDDIVDFLGADRPGPVFQVLNNIFLGGRDDGIDLDGTDAHVEGNIFTGFHKTTTRATTSNAIATGLPQTGDLALRTQITVVRNVFYDNDHAILLKEDAFGTVVNNVFADSTLAAIQFHEIGGTAVGGPGRGAYLDGNIFSNTPQLFKNVQPTTQLVVNRSRVTASEVNLGVGNITADPLFVDPANRDYHLQPNSPAIGTGPNGRDMGAFVPAGASINGEPTSPTTETSATLTVGGPDIYGYKYRVNGGPWSAEIATLNRELITVSVPPIVLTNLVPGSYTVEVIAKNSAGVWQPESAPTVSETWVVLGETPATVVGRHIFYNQSFFDGGDAGASAADDGAIAPDKTPLLAGQTATFANYTNYLFGINGLMIDIADLAGTPTAGDFTFKVGNDNTPSAWSTLATAPSISVREGAGGSDRVTLIWPNFSIFGTWLEVTVNASANTGVETPNVFYWGNAIGEAMHNAGSFQVTATDEIFARNNPRSVVNPAPIDFKWDYNRDSRVTATDQIIARNNRTTILNMLRVITIPVALEASGLAEGDTADLDSIASSIAAGKLNDATAQRTGSALVASGLSSTKALKAAATADAAVAASLADGSLGRTSKPAAADDDLFALLASAKR